MTEIKFRGNLAGINTSARPITFGIEGDSKIVVEAAASEQLSVISLLALGKVTLDFSVSVSDEQPGPIKD